MPWRPVKVSPIGVERFFGRRGAAVMLSELVYVWLPLAILWLCGRLLRIATKSKRERFVGDSTVRLDQG